MDRSCLRGSCPLEDFEAGVYLSACSSIFRDGFDGKGVLEFAVIDWLPFLDLEGTAPECQHG